MRRGSVDDSLLFRSEVKTEDLFKWQWVYCWYERLAVSRTSSPPHVKRKLPPFHMFHLRSFTQWPDSHWDWIPLWAWKDILNAGVFPFPSYLIRMSLFPALLLYIFSLLWLCADSLFTQAWAAPGQRSEGWKQEEGRARLLIQAALLSAYLLRGNWRESCWMPAGFVLKTLAFQRHQ